MWNRYQYLNILNYSTTITKNILFFFNLILFLFCFKTTWRHSNMAVQKAVPLIVTYVSDKAILNELRSRNFFQNVNINNGLLFRIICSLITATVRTFIQITRVSALWIFFAYTSFEQEKSIAFLTCRNNFYTMQRPGIMVIPYNSCNLDIVFSTGF